MRRLHSILFAVFVLGWIGDLMASVIPPASYQRFNLRWQGRTQARPLPLAGARPVVPVFPWAPTNAIAGPNLSTNRAVLPDTMRVLFLGNSLTSGHDMPGVLTRMSARSKQRIAATTRAIGGYTLQNHLVDPVTRTNIYSSVPDILNPTNRIAWHAVILQEQSQMPVYAWQRMAAAAQGLNTHIQAARTQVALFMPQSRPDQFFSQTDFLNRVEGGYQFTARQLGNCPVVPVGRAWQIAEARHPEIQLRDRDSYHPSPHGAYLTACMFYAYLTWQSPLGLSNGGLHAVKEREAVILQRIAWETFAAIRQGIPF